MSTTHVGSTLKFAENWDTIFAGKRGKPAPKKAAAQKKSAPSATTAAASTAKKQATATAPPHRKKAVAAKKPVVSVPERASGAPKKTRPAKKQPSARKRPRKASLAQKELF